MNTNLIFILCILTAVCYAVPKTPCEVPETWSAEGNRFYIGEGEIFHDYLLGDISYDFPHKWVRFDSFSFVNVSKNASFFLNFNQDIGYCYDRTSHDCVAFSLQGQLMHEAQIPDDSVLTSTRLIGSQSIDTWTIPTMKEIVRVSVTSGTCFPTDAVVITANQTLLMFWWNFIPTISPYAFDLPYECSSLDAGYFTKAFHNEDIVSAELIRRMGNPLSF